MSDRGINKLPWRQPSASRLPEEISDCAKKFYDVICYPCFFVYGRLCGICPARRGGGYVALPRRSESYGSFDQPSRATSAGEGGHVAVLTAGPSRKTGDGRRGRHAARPSRQTGAAGGGDYAARPSSLRGAAGEGGYAARPSYLSGAAGGGDYAARPSSLRGAAGEGGYAARPSSLRGAAGEGGYAARLSSLRGAAGEGGYAARPSYLSGAGGEGGYAARLSSLRGAAGEGGYAARPSSLRGAAGEGGYAARPSRQTAQSAGQQTPLPLSPAHLSQEDLCVVCKDRAPNSIVIPCGHKCVCDTCGQRLRVAFTTCPLCRTPFVGITMCK